MINFKTGNILDESSEAIVNTVNCVGVMGKGLALQYKKKFPENFKKYKSACDKNEVKIGKMFITESADMFSNHWIVNFPTKKHWKDSSQIEFIEQGLIDLVEKIKEYKIKSIAIPPLGAGLGGLPWNAVKTTIISSLKNIEDVAITVYEPKGSPVASAMQINTTRPNMTLGRSLLIKLLEFYFKKEYECTKIEIQKLAYFLQESGVDLKLRYSAHEFGPYADNLNHVLERIDGHFIKGVGDRVTFSEITLLPDSIKEANEFLERDIESRSCLKKVEQLIDGYETPLSMEVLATVHWVLKHENYEINNFHGIKEFIHKWNDRKASWKDTYLKKAISRLEMFSWI